MDHPFTSKLQLTEYQLNAVYGGSQVLILPANDIAKLKPLIKPAKGSTMAIGEEGGFFDSY